MSENKNMASCYGDGTHVDILKDSPCLEIAIIDSLFQWLNYF